MDRSQAKQVLQALRPSDLDTTKPLFAEALAMVETDPELRVWWAAQQDFDRKIADKLDLIPIPPDLRANILGLNKVEPFTLRPFFPFWLAAAAMVAIFCALSTSYHVEYLASQHISTDTFTASTLGFLGNDAPSLAMTSPDHGQLMAWLKTQGAPTGAMPDKMAALPGIGCQKIVIGGHNVSLVCFQLADGKIVHLFMVARSAMQEPPLRAAPDMKMINGWATASWSDERMSYMLATKDGMDTLRGLL